MSPRAVSLPYSIFFCVSVFILLYNMQQVNKVCLQQVAIKLCACYTSYCRIYDRVLIFKFVLYDNLCCMISSCLCTGAGSSFGNYFNGYSSHVCAWILVNSWTGGWRWAQKYVVNGML